MIIKFFRHGDKNSKGNLSEKGKEQASVYGKNLHISDNQEIQIYSSSKKRVLKTVKIIINSCVSIDDSTRINISKHLSVDAFLYDSDKSEFFKKYSNLPQKTYAQKIKKERNRMHSWLQYQDQPDSGTASSFQVFNEVCLFIKKIVRNDQKSLSNEKSKTVLCGTHEFILAALVHHLLKSKDEINLTRIKYLEDLELTISSKEGVVEYLRFRDNRYSLSKNLY